MVVCLLGQVYELNKEIPNKAYEDPAAKTSAVSKQES